MWTIFFAVWIMCDEAEIRKVLGEAFDQCDADKSGFLDKGEIVKVLNSYNSSAQCKHKKTAAQLDQDAKVYRITTFRLRYR